jgi:hypothetical protein
MSEVGIIPHEMKEDRPIPDVDKGFRYRIGVLP